MSDLSTSAIYDAISSLEREANYRWNVGGSSNLERYRDLNHIVKNAMAEYNALSAAMPRLRSLKADADRQYDDYVTREPDCCSCHINPPCGYCTRDADGGAS